MATKTNKQDDKSPSDFPGLRAELPPVRAGTYLIAADPKADINPAIQAARKLALSTEGHVGILHAIRLEEFQQWRGVENMMRSELRAKAEDEIWRMADRVAAPKDRKFPVYYLEEGDLSDALHKVLHKDPHIVMVILAVPAQGGPTPLIESMTGKGISRLPVPLMLVPSGHASFSERPKGHDPREE